MPDKLGLDVSVTVLLLFVFQASRKYCARAVVKLHAQTLDCSLLSWSKVSLLFFVEVLL